ncbi:ATP-binding protein [Neptuniibacter sp. QD34_54]|uniref:ATP-binding protein n=1 Tax=Neptuniibacter sp. QD34_54 TaxID=3398208 RepID=UPI0039F4650D
MRVTYRLLFAGMIFLLSQLSIAQITFGPDSEQPTIRFVGDKDYPPIEWLEDGKPRGIFASFLEEYSKALNRKVEYNLMNWKQAQQAVLEGRADVLTVFSPNPDRIKDYAFVDSFLQFEISLFLRSDNLTIHGLADLKGIKTGVSKGGFPRKIIETQSQAKLVTMNDHLDGFQKLLQGEIDALATTKWVGSYIIQKHKLKGIKFAPTPIATKATHMGVRKSDTELVKQLQQGIELMEAEGTLDRLNQQWSGYNMVYLTEDKLNQIYYQFGFGTLLVLACLAVASIITLKRQVKERTQSLSTAKASLEETVDRLTRTQKQLVQTEKMAALNSIVSGVAHEINTPLGMAITLSSTLQEQIAQLEKLVSQDSLTKKALLDFLIESQDSLELEAEALRRAVTLLRNFKQISVHQSQEHRQQINIAELIDDATVIATNDLADDEIAVSVNGDATLSMETYPAPLAQALVHLINNAVTHAPKQTDPLAVSISYAQSENNLILKVADNGCGIPSQYLGQVFDPFFTTTLGQGNSGLGLSIVYSIVNHVLGGTIKVNSNSDTGTTFILELPLNAPEIHDDIEVQT